MSFYLNFIHPVCSQPSAHLHYTAVFIQAAGRLCIRCPGYSLRTAPCKHTRTHSTSPLIRARARPKHPGIKTLTSFLGGGITSPQLLPSLSWTTSESPNPPTSMGWRRAQQGSVASALTPAWLGHGGPKVGKGQAVPGDGPSHHVVPVRTRTRPNFLLCKTGLTGSLRGYRDAIKGLL